ncbi:hypothetical protein Glove_262g55 [Diversispora epigaea]|uniref:F-box domain-containing protein n=1 Tax=Diversispora epigaea TaxID=1348612 RepID=A0A397I5T7_9GLOM|nr:hypothetical protein Glove_262g55 [Diversispora epigaea]
MDYLPNELIIEIFNYALFTLNIRVFFKLRRVCKRWNQLVSTIMMDEIYCNYKDCWEISIIYFQRDVLSIYPKFNREENTFDFEINKTIPSYYFHSKVHLFLIYDKIKFFNLCSLENLKKQNEKMSNKYLVINEMEMETKERLNNIKNDDDGKGDDGKDDEKEKKGKEGRKKDNKNNDDESVIITQFGSLFVKFEDDESVKLISLKTKPDIIFQFLNFNLLS